MTAAPDISIIPAPRYLERGEGGLALRQGATIHCVDETSETVARLFAEEVETAFGLRLVVRRSEQVGPGELIFGLKPKDGAPPESYALEVKDRVRLGAVDEDGLLAGTATLLQILRRQGKAYRLPRLVVRDHPQRAFRALMIDVKNHWHGPEEIRRFVRLCRLYKVKHLSLHTGEAQWIGAVTDQVGRLSPEDRRRHRLYARAEMDDLIAYARRRGVLMMPHNECTPHFGHQIDSMRKDYVPGDKTAGFADELDGRGAFDDYDGKASERWLGVMERALGRAVDQFAAGHPGGVLPFFHIGPVQGEGGMSPVLAARIVTMIRKKSPGTRVMFWNGVNARDKTLAPLRDDIVIAYYDDEFGASDLDSYLREGWTVVNAAWSPLYVVGANLARPVERVFEDWNLTRQGSDGVPGGYGAVSWESLSDEADPALIRGGMLCTWEVPTAVHFVRVRRRLAAFAEHAWGAQTWPYAEGAFADFRRRLSSIDRELGAYLGDPKSAPRPPVRASATLGTAKGRVKLRWRPGGGAVATSYRIYRGDTRDLAEAEEVSESLDFLARSFEDRAVEAERRYFYWIRAENAAGASEPVGPLKGGAGTGIANIAAHEPFAYLAPRRGDGRPKVDLDGAAGGTGWRGPWRIETGAASVGFDPKGLEYGPLSTRGGSLRVHPKHDKDRINLVRDIEGRMGLDETTMWMSYLVRPDTVGIGDVFVVPNDYVFAAVGKNWGQNFALYTSASAVRMEKGRTHLVVARFDFDEGDEAWLWIDPPLDREPKKSEAVQRLRTEIGSGSRVRIQLQGYGQGDYRLDELRLGASWAAVGGLKGADDETAPQPSPMTWVGPPSREDDGSIYMIAAPASDASGVEYYFECQAGGAPDSGWQSSREYRVATRDLPGPGRYAFRVRTRDGSIRRNVSAWSFAGSVTIPD